MNARKKTQQKTQLVKQNKKNINILVRATAAIVAVLLIFYFVVTLNNMTNISKRLEDRKDGTFPASVAAGHIETTLACTLSVMQMILAVDTNSVLEIDSDGILTLSTLDPTEEITRLEVIDNGSVDSDSSETIESEEAPGAAATYTPADLNSVSVESAVYDENIARGIMGFVSSTMNRANSQFIVDAANSNAGNPSSENGENGSDASERAPLFNEAAVSKISELNDTEIQSQLAILTSNRFADEKNIHDLVVTYNDINKELANTFELWGRDPNNLPIVQAQIADNVIPLIERAIAADNAIIDSTSKDIEDLNNTVLEAIQQTILFSLVLIMGIFVAIFIYISLLSRKEEYEEELSNHLTDALALAQNASDAKSDFLSNMSHDIRTPLNAIIGLSAIAEDNINDPVKMRQCLTQINTSSHHLLQLINDVLDVNRIESGKTILTNEVFSLPDLVSELSTINEPQIAEKSLNAEFILKNIQHEYLVGDPIRIRQIVLNLTSNAIKYTKPGDSMTVTFEEFKATRPQNANLRITVSDTGVGMSPEFVEHIFEPFERERNERTSFIEGTGLGMAITKNLVTMMNGTIKVESELGEGSTFIVDMVLHVANQFPKLDTDCFEGANAVIISDNDASSGDMSDILEEFGILIEKIDIAFDDMDGTIDKIERLVPNADAVFVEYSEHSELDDQAIGRIEDVLTEAVGEKSVTVVRIGDVWKPIKHKENGNGVVAYIKRPVFRSRVYEVLRETHDIMEDDLKMAATNSEEGKAGENENAADGQKTSRVLIVEDNDLNMEIATELVLKYVPQVDQAFNGQEALDIVKEKPEGYYDLIFMDWQMPVMDGIEATKAIIRHFDAQGYKHTPIVAMTANAFNDNRRDAMAAGMDGFMAKPINLKELKENLSKYCGVA